MECALGQSPHSRYGTKQRDQGVYPQQDMFDAARPVLVDHFSGAFSLPFYSGRLFDDLGFMGDSECA